MVANVLQPILYFQKQFSSVSSDREKKSRYITATAIEMAIAIHHIYVYNERTEKKIGIELGKMECNHLGQFKQYVLNCRANFVKYPLKRTEVCVQLTQIKSNSNGFFK